MSIARSCFRGVAVLVVLVLSAIPALGAKLVSLKVGHVGHDHHTALFVAADLSKEYEAVSGISLKVVKDKQFYDLYDGTEKLAEIELIKVGGGSKMPAALAQGIIEVGLGGVAPVLATNDKGAPVKMIAPLHFKGDMFVVRPDFPAKDWRGFVSAVKKSDVPIRIGYKSPVAVAKIILEEALKHEGISFGGPMDGNAKVHLINVKSGGNLNVSITAGIIDAYAGNNPFPAIGVEKKVARIISDLEDLPPGTFLNHPCCCIGANTKSLAAKGRAVEALLVLMIQATETINKDCKRVAPVAARWVGTSDKVELESLPTSGFSMNPTKDWHKRMDQWVGAMNRLDTFTGQLKGLSEADVAKKAYDFSLLENAFKRIEVIHQKR